MVRSAVCGVHVPKPPPVIYIYKKKKKKKRSMWARIGPRRAAKESGAGRTVLRAAPYADQGTKTLPWAPQCFRTQCPRRVEWAHQSQRRGYGRLCPAPLECPSGAGRSDSGHEDFALGTPVLSVTRGPAMGVYLPWADQVLSARRATPGGLCERAPPECSGYGRGRTRARRPCPGHLSAF